MTSDEQQKWLEWVLVTSIPLRRLGPDDLPIGIASGCLVDYRNRRFLLTVSHAVNLGQSDWVIQLGDHAAGTEIYKPFPFIYPRTINRNAGQMSEVDFTFAEVATNIEPVFQHMTPRGPMSERRPRHVFDLKDVDDPDVDELYAFAGEIFPDIIESYALVTQPTVYPGLRYIGTDDLYHQFQLPVPHPGHRYFKGCSGAPIVDIKGRLVGLVTSGDEEGNMVSGITLSNCKPALDFYCENIRPI